MSHIWPFLRDTVYTVVFYGLVFTGLFRCAWDVVGWFWRKVDERRRREAIKRFADLESGETYFL